MKNPHNLSTNQLCVNAKHDIHLHTYNKTLVIVDGVRTGSNTTPAAASYRVKELRIRRVLCSLGYPTARDVLPFFKDRQSLRENVDQNIKIFDMAKEHAAEQMDLF